MISGRDTEYGFEWGPAEIQRGFADDKKGWVVLLLKTAKHPGGLQLYVTKSGKVRVHCKNGEWRLPKQEQS